MQLEVGKIVEGKVTGITKFGAFVELETGEVGMVHISEVAPTYVNDISEHLQVGQTVKVKVLAINDDKKISLSIKKAMPQQREFSKDRPQNNNGNRPRFNNNRPSGDRNGGHNNHNHNSREPMQPAYQRPAPKGPASFEDMLSKFMQSSDEKISDMKRSREVNRRAEQRRPK